MKYIENHDTAPGDEGAFSPSEVDDLSPEIEHIRNNPELLAFLAERSREKETFSLEDVKRELLHDVFAEVLEDIALAEAIRQGQQTEQVAREEIFRSLEGNG